MSGHDFEQQQTTTTAQPDHIVAAKDGGKPADVEVHRPPSEETWEKIQKILRRESKATGELPRLVSLLDDEHKDMLATDHWATLGQIVSGDIVIEVGRALDMPPATALIGSIDAKQTASKAALRRYVQDQSGDRLKTIEGDAFDKLKRAIGGKLAEELPAIIEKLSYLSGHPGFLTWFVDTTPPSIVAHQFGRNGDAELATTLEGLTTANKWAWVDHIHLAQGYEALPAIAKAAPDPIKQKLEAKLGPVADASQAKLFRSSHAHDVTQALDSHAGVRELLDAIARVGRVEITESYKVIAAMEKLEPSADDVLAMSTMISVNNAAVFHMLMRAKGVTAQHIETYLFSTGGFSLLASDAKLLADVRKRLPALRIRDVIQGDGMYAPDKLVDSEALRKWFFETAAPVDLAWFCGGDQSPRACKLMDRHDSSWKWVYELSADTQKRQLRAIALNCPKAEVTRYVREVLLAEPAPRHEIVDTAEAPSPDVRTGAAGRVLDAVSDYDNVLERIADLDEAQRARYGRVDEFVESVAQRLGPTDFARAAVLLQLDFARVVAHCPGSSSPIVAYLRTRPRSEEQAVLGSRDLVARAVEHVHPDPLIVFPSLHEPEQLAKAIEHNPKLVELLFKHSDPNVVADLLSRDVVARTEKILDKHPELLDWLPRYRHMSKRGTEGVDRLAKPAHGEVADALHEIHDNEYDPRSKVKDEGITASGARKQATAAAAIKHVLDNGGSATTMLGVLGDFNQEQITALLRDPANASVVGSLAAVVALPAPVVFPQLTLESLLAMPNSRTWLFEDRAATVLLDAIASRPAALAKVAGVLDESETAQTWLSHLPVGSALTDVEVRALDRMQPSIKTAPVLASLFAVRFGVPIPTEWDAPTLADVYRTLCRLPRSHLNQQRIKEIAEGTPDAGKAGYWSGEKVVISSNVKPGGDSETYNSEQRHMPKAQLQRLYGWNDAELAVQVKLGNVRYYVGADQYEVVADKVDKFTSTVLHEIGHSIDDILGGHTAPVFEMAQWRSYAQGDVDKWAAEMGGWDKVASADQKKIAEVWVDSIRSSTPVHQLVDGEHPAMASRYSEVGIVAKAREKESFNYGAPAVIGERAFVMQPYYGRFYSVAATAVQTKPSGYSMFAPAEYFAECYVEYYREVDGSRNARANKGGALPQPIKNWFSNNVDTLKYDPQRFKKSDDSAGE